MFGAARKVHDDQLQPLYAGAAAELLSDVPSAAEVIRDLVTEAQAALQRW